MPSAEAIDGARKYVVSSTLGEVDWNAELLRGELGQAVERLKREPGEGLWVGGVTLPLALADLGLILTSTSSLCSRSLPDTGRRCSPVCASAFSSSSWIAMSSGRGAVAVRYRPRREPS